MRQKLRKQILRGRNARAVRVKEKKIDIKAALTLRENKTFPELI